MVQIQKIGREHNNIYRIAGNVRMVLIFVYFVCSIPYTKIKNYKNLNVKIFSSACDL